MAIGITSSTNAIKIKNESETGIRAVGCECCVSCDYDAWQFSVSQAQVGYTGFSCKDSQPGNTRYLQYQVLCNAGFTGTWCGAFREPEVINITTRIDPYSGLSETTGLPPNGYTCGGGSNCKETCNETSKTYTCTAQPDNCIDEEITQTVYHLLEPNTINDVIDRITPVLNGLGTDDLPGPNTSGTVKIGSEGLEFQSGLAWQPFNGEPSASRWTSNGVVQLTKSVVKLKRNLRYKIVSYDSSGASTTQEYDGLKDTLIYLNPPSSDGSKYFRMPGGFYEWEDYDWDGNPIIYRYEWDGELRPCPIVEVTTQIVSTNQLTTKTLQSSSQGQSCANFHIGPDCKKYTQKVTETEYNGTDSYKHVNTVPTNVYTASSYYSASGKTTTTQIACSPAATIATSTSNYSQSGTNSSSGDSFSNTSKCTNGKYIDTYTNTGAYAGLPSGQSNTVTYERESSSCGYIPQCVLGFYGPSCNPVCGEDSNSVDVVFNSAQKGTHSIQCWRGSYKSGESRQSNTKTYEDFPKEGANNTGSTSCESFFQTTSTWSGEVNESSFDDDNQNTNFNTESWTEEGGLCAWKALATNGTMNECTANVIIYFTVNGNPLKDYNVTVEMVIEETRIINNNSFRLYHFYEETFTTKGGVEKASTRSLVASSPGYTKCLVHYAVVAYEA
jgi:hypothetical protein